MLQKKEIQEMIKRELESLIFTIQHHEKDKYIETQEKFLYDTVEACVLIYNRQHRGKRYIGGNEFIEEILKNDNLNISVLFNHYYESTLKDLALILSVRGLH